MIKTITFTVLSLVFAAAWAGAQAMGPEAQTRGGVGACKEDLEKLCPQAKDHRAVLRCLDKNESKLSQPCREAYTRMHKNGRGHARTGATRPPAPTPHPANQP